MLSKKSQNITKDDISHLEGIIGYNLPADFIEHYLSVNGGHSDKSFFYVEADYGYKEVNYFLPIKYPNSIWGDMTINNIYQDLINRNVIPNNYLPFAIDYGCNFFSIDINTNDIVIIYMDLGEVTADAIKYLTTGFSNFIDNLEEQGDEEDI